MVAVATVKVCSCMPSGDFVNHPAQTFYQRGVRREPFEAVVFNRTAATQHVIQ